MSKLAQINVDLEDTRTVLHHTVGALVERASLLDSVVEKSEALVRESGVYSERAADTNRCWPHRLFLRTLCAVASSVPWRSLKHWGWTLVTFGGVPCDVYNIIASRGGRARYGYRRRYLSAAQIEKLEQRRSN